MPALPLSAGDSVCRADSSYFLCVSGLDPARHSPSPVSPQTTPKVSAIQSCLETSVSHEPSQQFGGLIFLFLLICFRSYKRTEHSNTPCHRRPAPNAAQTAGETEKVQGKLCVAVGCFASLRPASQVMVVALGPPGKATGPLMTCEYAVWPGGKKQNQKLYYWS